MIRVCFAHHLGNTVNAHGLRVGVVKKGPIANSHIVSHEIAGLIVAHTIPTGLPITPQVSDGVDPRFRFHQPVTLASCHNPSQACLTCPHATTPARPYASNTHSSPRPGTRTHVLHSMRDLCPLQPHLHQRHVLLIHLRRQLAFYRLFQDMIHRQTE